MTVWHEDDLEILFDGIEAGFLVEVDAGDGGQRVRVVVDVRGVFVDLGQAGSGREQAVVPAEISSEISSKTSSEVVIALRFLGAFVLPMALAIAVQAASFCVAFVFLGLG
jgi:hypothetical protein